MTDESDRDVLAEALDDAMSEWFGPPSDGMSAATRRAIRDATIETLGARGYRLAPSPEPLRAALERIVTYEPDWFDGDLPDHSTCEECQRRREANWPPSGMCEALYSAIVRRDDENKHRQCVQHYALRAIAETALAEYAALAESRPMTAETGDLWGPDGHPLPDVPEEARQQMYLSLLADGLSDAEALGTIWPRAALAKEDPDA